MKILVFSNDCAAYAGLVCTIRHTVGQTDELSLIHMNDYDDLRRDLVKNEYDLVIVAEKGALGMEICIGVRKIRPHIPLFWFSDDSVFAAQSYRLNCTYFGALPASERVMANAFSRIRETAVAWGT